jgi:hypothetical protein
MAALRASRLVCSAMARIASRMWLILVLRWATWATALVGLMHVLDQGMDLAGPAQGLLGRAADMVGRRFRLLRRLFRMARHADCRGAHLVHGADRSPAPGSDHPGCTLASAVCFIPLAC